MINHNPLKVTSTLSDETRFSIYQYMLQEKKPFSVQEIADHFHIHPNVARLHLTKLTEIDVISAEYEKTGKGGRPGRRYKALEDGISLSFPKRNNEELLDWAIDILGEFGEEAYIVGQKICYKKGRNEIEATILKQRKEITHLTFEEKLEILTDTAALIGYIPMIKETPAGKTLSFAIYNCPFHTEIKHNARLVCALHESYLKGQFDALFNVSDFVQVENMMQNCEYCTYQINI